MKANATAVAVVIALLPAISGPAFGHGVAGKRFFPATIAIDDPLVADELSLPTVSTIREPGEGDEPSSRETEISGEFSKRLTPNLGLSLEGGVTRHQPRGRPSVSGLGNLEAAVKYQYYRNDPRETILSAAVSVEIGGSGHSRVAESFSTWTPALFAGKGFGDLPESLAVLKPLAVTGAVGVTFPTRSSTTRISVDPDTLEAEVDVERHPHVLEWGLAVHYSVAYLQSSVKDIGLRYPANRLIPVVELAMSTPLDRGGGASTGTVNPGLLWAGSRIQLGLEAMIPINGRTGTNVGVRGQVHLYLDDLLPGSLGRPLFGGSK